jgi:hypothetical protein
MCKLEITIKQYGRSYQYNIIIIKQMIANILQPHLNELSSEFFEIFSLSKLDVVMTNHKVISAIKNGTIEVNKSNKSTEHEYKQQIVKLKE